MNITYVDQSNTYLPISALLAPMGFSTYSTNVGIKDDTLDFTVIYSAVPANAAAMFTQNRFCGAPIHVGRENIANGVLRSIVVNSKNANVATGDQGIANVREIITLVSKELVYHLKIFYHLLQVSLGCNCQWKKLKREFQELRKRCTLGDLIRQQKRL